MNLEYFANNFSFCCCEITEPGTSLSKLSYIEKTLVQATNWSEFALFY